MQLIKLLSASTYKNLPSTNNNISTTTIRCLAQTLLNKYKYSTSSTGRTADPALYTNPQEERGENPKEVEEELEEHVTTRDDDPYVPPKTQPVSSPKLKSSGVNKPIKPMNQQKRHHSSTTEGVTCVGFDGSPLPEERNDGEFRRQRKEQEEDDKEYFSHHKASPLSEIEMADSRKPVTRATDGGGGGDGDGVVLFTEEQRDSAEDALRRAVEMWREAKVRGDPYSPHGRVLRELRGEYW